MICKVDCRRNVFFLLFFLIFRYFHCQNVQNFAYFCVMKHAIIVGASSGIGREVALRLLAEGWTVGLAARRTEPMQGILQAYPDQTTIQSIDINATDAPQRLDRLIEETGGMDLYLHTSGIGKQNNELQSDIELQTVETNALGFTRMIDHVFRRMGNSGGGHIAVISSIAGTKGLGPAPSYSATKAFQSTYIQALEQLSNARRLGITFTDVRPGFVSTPLIEGSNYPFQLSAERTAKLIVSAINHRRHVAVIDWKYRILVFFWRLLPNCIWRRLNLTDKKTDKIAI